MYENPWTSDTYLINKLSEEERFALKKSLLNKEIKIIFNPEFGFFTEHGFPVAIATYEKKTRENPINHDFYAKVIEIEPMVTIYELP